VVDQPGSPRPLSHHSWLINPRMMHRGGPEHRGRSRRQGPTPMRLRRRRGSCTAATRSTSRTRTRGDVSGRASAPAGGPPAAGRLAAAAARRDSQDNPQRASRQRTGVPLSCSAFLAGPRPASVPDRSAPAPPWFRGGAPGPRKSGCGSAAPSLRRGGERGGEGGAAGPGRVGRRGSLPLVAGGRRRRRVRAGDRRIPAAEKAYFSREFR
jgi:hypothetical protein